MRISYAGEDPKLEKERQQAGNRPMRQFGANANAGAGAAGAPPNLPQGIALPPGISSTDAISSTLAAVPPNQLLDILAQMRVSRLRVIPVDRTADIGATLFVGIRHHLAGSSKRFA